MIESWSKSLYAKRQKVKVGSKDYDDTMTAEACRIHCQRTCCAYVKTLRCTKTSRSCSKIYWFYDSCSYKKTHQQKLYEWTTEDNRDGLSAENQKNGKLWRKQNMWHLQIVNSEQKKNLCFYLGANQKTMSFFLYKEDSGSRQH